MNGTTLFADASGAPLRLTARRIEKIRTVRGASTLLFITDRCPVGCAHCSVDSRRDSPTVSDYPLFEQIVDWLCTQPGLQVVGVSGGEPFVERRGLSLVARRVHEAGRRLVIYTSGTWAVGSAPPPWIQRVLDVTSTVYLSTDAFHAAGVPDGRYVRAARAIAASDAWIVVQVIDQDGMVERARHLLELAFGSRFDEYAEIRPTRALTAGRGEQVFIRKAQARGADFGRCTMVASPMVRYDGVVTACCNESVIMGHGPRSLRASATTASGFDAAFEGFHDDPFLHAIEHVGVGPLTAHPRFADLADQRFASICDVCWKMLGRTEADESPDRLLEALGEVV